MKFLLARFPVFPPSRFLVFPFSRFLILAVVATLLITTTAFAQEVDIPDPNLKQVIRETLQLPDGQPITQQDMLKLTRLDGRQTNITDLTGLKHATNLTDLYLVVNAIENLEPLSGLIRLQTLDLSDNQIVDITPLANLTNLTELEVSSNQLRDLTPLAGLTRLTFLGLWNNRISDLNPLMNLTALQTLWLNSNEIVDITPLANLTNLTELTLSRNQLRDLTPLMNLTALQTLWLHRNVIVDITPLANLTNLTELRASQNQVRDLNPLMNLTALQTLRLNMNEIVDITPLIGLKNLKELWIADNPIRDFSPLTELEGVELDLDVDFNQLDQLHLVVTIPDPNLEGAIRDQLNRKHPIPPDAPITVQYMLKLTWLDAREKNITDLTGIEEATNLIHLYIGGNQIQDITLLANLTKLRQLRLGSNNLESIEPLASMIQLETLSLTGNLIQDITPLANLINLENLHITENLATDFTPLQGLNLSYLEYDEVCDFPPLLPPVRERMERRSFPSIFAWNADISTLELEHLTPDERTALHGLDFGPRFAITWDLTPTEPAWGVATSLAGQVALGREKLQHRTSINPNIVFLREIGFHDSSEEDFPPGSDFLLRDENGELIRKRTSGTPRTNLFNPEFQDLLVKRVIGIERCGFFDGIFIDQFANHGLTGHRYYGVSPEELIQVFIDIFKAIREEVRDDFLILINTNRDKATYYAEYVNGTFMEAGNDSVYMSGLPGGFSYDGLKEIESTLSWSEENLRSPQINCLEGWGIPAEEPDSPENQRWMRVITTLSLTHSDGYVMYTTGWGSVPVCPECPYPWGPAHEHIWYDFWDTDLGRPVGPKVQYRQNIEDSFKGLFIREFTNGWAVYNRSGKAQTITLPASATPVSDRGNNAASQTHLLPNFDGEIYLKLPSPYDLNRDGTINVLDLLLVSQHFGTAAGDVNGDGTTDIHDLTLVAQQFNLFISE